MCQTGYCEPVWICHYCDGSWAEPTGIFVVASTPSRRLNQLNIQLLLVNFFFRGQILQSLILSACLYPMPRLRYIENSVLFSVGLWRFSTGTNYICLIHAIFCITQFYYWFKDKHITEGGGILVDPSIYSKGTLRYSNIKKGTCRRGAVALWFKESTFESLCVTR